MAKELQAHAYANIFPLADGPPLWELRDDIQANGYSALFPLVLYQGQILDGRRRQECCHMLNIEPPVTTFEGTPEQALAFVKSANWQRRHLGEADRALAAGKIAQEFAKLAAARQHAGTLAPAGAKVGKASENASELTGVPVRTIEKAKAVLEHGTPKLQQAVRDGTVSVTDAAAVATEAPAVQDAAVQAVKGGMAKTAKQAAAANGKRKPKSGTLVFDDRSIDKLIGKLVHAIDARAKAMGKTGGYLDMEKRLQDLLHAWKRWQLEQEKR